MLISHGMTRLQLWVASFIGVGMNFLLGGTSPKPMSISTILQDTLNRFCAGESGQSRKFFL